MSTLDDHIRLQQDLERFTKPYGAAADFQKMMESVDAASKPMREAAENLAAVESIVAAEKLERLTKPLGAAAEAQKMMESIDAASKPMREAVESLAVFQKLAASANTGLSLPSIAVPDVSYMHRQMEDLGRAAAETREAPMARRAVERILAEIRAFETNLDDTTEVGLRLVAFGQVAVVHVDEISYYQPNLVIFVGRNEDGSPVRLMQHISQLSFILCREARQQPDTPRRPVGFVVPEDRADRAD